ncbi:MAG: BTAD domain-containing putative transcriptional regulator [Anaerolineae bacterium]
MLQLKISLLGKFQLQYGSLVSTGCESQKAQELLCYLLLYRHTPHTREKLATIFWPEYSTAKAKKYLRQALWQLQTTLEKLDFPVTELLQVETDWIQVKCIDAVGLDIVVLENAFANVQDVSGRNFNETQYKEVQEATAVYHGKLLDGWYHEWCLCEQERLHNFYLLLLDKLVDYCEHHHCYEMGIWYGMEILLHDIAFERAHRRLMRLFYNNGNRTAAIRQYEKCVQALHDELGVKPAQRTVDLAAFIQGSHSQPELSPSDHLLDPLLVQLHTLQADLNQIQTQISTNIQGFQSLLSPSNSPQ